MTSPSSSTAHRRPLTRSTTDKKLAGVAGGLAAHLGVDPLLVRIGFVVTTLCGGAGLLAYLGLWAFAPSEDDESASAPSAPAAPYPAAA
jgi:phage shock protein PspC (stress-responsive transcriptional regulator)